MNEKKSSQEPIFFYAENEAESYDSTIGWVAPYYKSMHEMMVRLANESTTRGSAGREFIHALDIGSGTGAEALPLMQSIPHLRVMALDIAPQMNAIFRRNATSMGIAESRFRLTQGDITATDFDGMIRLKAKESFGVSEFDLIISAFTLHHFTVSQRARIFKTVHDLLSSGGVFLLGDLFNFSGESPWLTEAIFNWEVTWISNNFDRAAKEAERESKTDEAAHLRMLSAEWMRHYTFDNKLDGISGQLGQLGAAGFKQTGNPFRYWQVGLIWARK